jgi:hypothetical protein
MKRSQGKNVARKTSSRSINRNLITLIYGNDVLQFRDWNDALTQIAQFVTPTNRMANVQHALGGKVVLSGVSRNGSLNAQA